MAMSRKFELMILVNVLLGFLFIMANLVYDYFGNAPSHHAVWSPLWLTFYNYQAATTFGDIGVQEPNFSFYFFWTLLFVNVYFLFRLQRGNDYRDKR
jgi:hypothetical protein